MRTATKILPAAGMIASLALAAAIALTTATANCQAGSTSKPADANTFVSKKDGFSVTFPAGWKRGEAPPAVGVLFVKPPDESSATLGGNVFVGAEYISSGEDLDAYAKASLATMSKGLNEFKLLSSTSAKLGENNAKRIVYRHKKGPIEAKVLNYFIVAGSRAYVLVCTSIVDEYPSYEPIFEGICKTFTVFAADPPTPQKFRSDTDGFTITGPPMWQQVEGGHPFPISFVEPLGETSDTFHENVKVGVGKRQHGMDLDAYVVSRMAGIAETANEFKQISSKRVTLGKLMAQRVVFQSKAWGLEFKTLCYILVCGDNGYGIICTSIAAEYEKYEPIFEDICKTFETFSPSNAGVPKPQPFRSEKDGFSIIFPAAWQRAQCTLPVVVMFMGPLADTSDKFRETVNITVTQLRPGDGLDQVVKGTIAAVAKTVKELKVISSTRVKLAEHTAQRVVLQHKAGGRDFEVLLYIVVTGRYGYTLTCTDTTAEYKEHEPIFEDICKTFETFEPAKTGAKEGKKDGTKTSPDSL